MITLVKVRRRAEFDAKTHGYNLTPRARANEERFGYPSCPCRMATGDFEIDRDIICPCDYRDPDVMEYGACFCCLYVDTETFESGEIKPIPERRPLEKQLRALDIMGNEATESKQESKFGEKTVKTDRKLWYCKQCGYIAFREEPPFVCPICRAKKEMFARISP